MSDPLTDFIAACRVEIKRVPDAADRVMAIAPLMAELAAMVAPHLGLEHRHSDPAHYARNAIHIDPSGDLSLFALAGCRASGPRCTTREAGAWWALSKVCWRSAR
jgi:hypothetical protein